RSHPSSLTFICQLGFNLLKNPLFPGPRQNRNGANHFLLVHRSRNGGLGANQIETTAARQQIGYLPLSYMSANPLHPKQLLHLMEHQRGGGHPRPADDDHSFFHHGSSPRNG